MHLPIPDAALSQHLIVLGKTRSGKSSTLRCLVERLYDAGKPVCIIDPKGDWWGLKSSADGKRPGLPFVIFGGDHADVPLNARAGADVAELVATGNRPCIVDLGGWMVGDRTRFFIDFAASLFRHTRGPRWLVIDEVHNFAPQGKIMDPDAGKMLHWANRLASEGSGKGLTLFSASQRPQKVHKDYVTSHETLIAMRVIHPLDRGAIKDWIDGCPDPAKGKAVMESLASMARGEGWVWSPEIGFGPVRIKFPMFRTYDSFKAPTGETTAKLKGWASVDLDEVRARLAAVESEAKANDPRELKRQIAELRRQIASVSSASDEVTKEEVKTKIDSALMNGRREGFSLGALESWKQFVGELDGLGDVIVVAVNKAIFDWRAKPRKTPLSDPPRPPKSVYANPMQKPRPALPSVPGEKLHGAERRFLTVLAQQDRVLTRNKIAVFAGYSSKSSHVDNTISSLRTKGFASGGRDGIQITDDGRRALGDYDPLPSGEELRNYWIGEVGAAERAFLKILFDIYPHSIGRDDLAERAGYSTNSSHVDNTISRLRTLDLAQGWRGSLKASDLLFDGHA